MFKDLKENRFKELEESVLSMREQRKNGNYEVNKWQI